MIGGGICCRPERSNIQMSLKSDALWEMARRYQLAAGKEEDLVEAEKYTKKAVEYYEEWSRS